VALTLPGATERVLRTAERCHVLEPTDSAGLRRALLELFEDWRSGGKESAPGGEAGIAAFERRRLTGALAALLDELVPAHAGPVPRAVPNA
jgi:hypothetical protein